MAIKKEISDGVLMDKDPKTLFFLRRIADTRGGVYALPPKLTGAFQPP
jgi:hypothetical protein